MIQVNTYFAVSDCETLSEYMNIANSKLQPASTYSTPTCSPTTRLKITAYNASHSGTVRTLTSVNIFTMQNFTSRMFNRVASTMKLNFFQLHNVSTYLGAGITDAVALFSQQPLSLTMHASWVYLRYVAMTAWQLFVGKLFGPSWNSQLVYLMLAHHRIRKRNYWRLVLPLWILVVAFLYWANM